MLVIGNVIGVGIFTTTGFIADDLPNAGLILLVWVFGGILSLAGAISCAELGAAMPWAGGDYIYLREAYGPLFGFLTGWNSFFISFSGSIAALAVGFAEYLSFFFPGLSMRHEIVSANFFGFAWSLSYGHWVAIASTVVLTIINYLGVRSGSLVQNVLSIIKMGAIGGIVILGFAIGSGEADNFVPFLSTAGQAGVLSAFGLALIPALFAYNGWNATIYVAGEVKNPKRNVPLSLILGTLITTILYVIINLVYIYAVPIEKMRGVLGIAELASTALFGQRASSYISALVMISIFGCLNAMILTGPRIYYAMAKDHVFFRGAAKVHPRFRAPGTSIILQAIWSCLLVISGTFEQLLTYVMFAIILFSTLTVAAVFVLRRSRPAMERPYKAWGYPYVPAIFILSSLWILMNTLIRRPSESLIGLGIVLLGIPAYLYWKKK